jgi:hypothetical protein
MLPWYFSIDIQSSTLAWKHTECRAGKDEPSRGQERKVRDKQMQEMDQINSMQEMDQINSNKICKYKLGVHGTWSSVHCDTWKAYQVTHVPNPTWVDVTMQKDKPRRDNQLLGRVICSCNDVSAKSGKKIKAYKKSKVHWTKKQKQTLPPWFELISFKR